MIFANSMNAELYKHSHKKNAPYILEASTSPYVIDISISGRVA